MNRLPDLTGKTVLVVGAVPCDIASIVRDFTIAASGGIKNAPDADMLVTIDNNMKHVVGWNEATFAGLRVTGIPSDDIAHTYIPLPYESVQVAPGNVVHARNNAISAIRIATERGAKHILLAGFDLAEYDSLNTCVGYAGVLTKALPALISELSAVGVTVEHAPTTTSIFPQLRRRRT